MKLGNFETNQVYNVDCYKAIKELPDNCIDCVYVDIPYLYHQGGSGSSEIGERTAKKHLELMGLESNYLASEGLNRREALRIAKNVKKTSIELTSIEDGIDYSILNEFVRVMKRVNIFIWCSKLQLLDIMNFFIGGGIQGKEINFELLIWNKTNPTPTTNNSWLPDIEYCLYFREKGVPLNNGYELKSKCFVSPANTRDKDRYNHPTIKPIELVKRHLLHTTQPNDIVFDCYMGSGTSCVAAKDIGRQYIGFEIEKKWFDIAVDRLNQTDANGQISLFLR